MKPECCGRALPVGRACPDCPLMRALSPPPPPPLSVVPFTGPNIADLAAGFRRMADALERGDYPDATHVAYVISRPAGVSTGIFGSDSNRFHTAGILQAAALQVLPKHNPWDA